MAVDQFLKIPDFKGESVAKGHADQIDILAWSWGASNSGNTHLGPGGGAGKSNFQDLSFTKYQDKATPELLKRVANGTHIKEAYLYVRKAGGKAEEYFSIKMEEIIVTSQSMGGSGGEDRLTENVTLNFAKFTLEYKVQKADGTLEPAGVKCIWDIATNADAR